MNCRKLLFSSVQRYFSKKSYPILSRMKGKGKKSQRILFDYYEDDVSVYGSSPASASSFLSDASYFVPKSLALKPRNDKQKEYVKHLEDVNISIIVATGPAGTGKTMIPSHVAIQKLYNNEINKLIITRPAVSVEEQHGFLPGTLEEKMEPWLRPIFDVFYQYYTPEKIQKLISHQTIEISPLAYMRGRTFEESWIIADEAQNMTPNQMLMLLTRIGNNSKMIITGDQKQHDRGFEQNGLRDFLNKIKNKDIPEIKHLEFTHEEVERHKVIPKILKLYEHH
jgi:phosphate starvation-inducible protein PhoH and related proteins